MTQEKTPTLLGADTGGICERLSLHSTTNHRKNAALQHFAGDILAAGCGSPIDKAQQPRQTIERGFFTSPGCVGHGFAYDGPCGWHRKMRRSLIPVYQRPHGLSPTLVALAAGSKPVDKEPIMADTPTPTSGTSTHDHTSLSFVKVEYKGPRKQRLTDWFAVPNEDYCTGNATGYRVAAEFMSWLQTRPATYETGMIVREIMAAAFAVLAEPHTQGKTGRRGAAVTFLDSMAGFIQFAATHSNHQAYLAGQAQRSENWAKESAQREVERNRETGRRLAAARKAKREAKAMEAGAA